MRAVAQLVGVTAPSIYMHFKDKDELLDAVCAEHFAALGRAMEEEAATLTDPLERLLAQGRAYVRFALARPEHYRLSTMISGKPGSVDEMIQDTCFQQLLATVDKCIGAGISPEAQATPSRSVCGCGRRRTAWRRCSCASPGSRGGTSTD